MLSAIDAIDRALDIACNWLADHPRLTCFAICILCLYPLTGGPGL